MGPRRSPLGGLDPVPIESRRAARDGDKARYMGKGVLEALSSVNGEIAGRAGRA